ncbi:hypothetical protein [Marinoscillum furvescens]|uniref:Uncharacterized protein n=1 Tax=Marinoscillum furvescens DSM 4134 TaxID=1122208 RepID=A0A3D9L8X2_MARFU|nr:hypothetical protein [Marinoscillum furvescens]REE02116.1 hypothetical protein C7460_102138 [Marinoscillum furvescens DSM 4134]
MRKIQLFLFIFSTLTVSSVHAQDAEESLGATIDKLTYAWDLEAENLKDYEGLTNFCVDKAYRFELIELLEDIHHYDSVLYKRLVKASRFNKTREIKKTLKEIETFEEEYSMKTFIHFLHEECKTRSEIESHSEELRNDIGANSYDGKIYMVETELNKFIKHITKRLDHIRDHVHHLHIE